VSWLLNLLIGDKRRDDRRQDEEPPPVRVVRVRKPLD
jgi:hypothetical protein